MIKMHEPSFENGSSSGEWQTFAFNFGGWPEPPMDVMCHIKNSQFKFGQEANLIRYYFRNFDVDKTQDDIEHIDFPLIILPLSTTNSAHSMSELAGFLDRIKLFPSNIKIVVNSFIEEKLPFLFQIVKRNFELGRIIRLDGTKTYYADNIYMPREIHFNDVVNWNEIKYKQQDSIIKFTDNNKKIKFRKTIEQIVKFCDKIYLENVHRFEPHSKICLIKTASDKYATTPGRAMELTEEAYNSLENYGFKICSIDQFNGIEEYICTLRNAKIFLTSYGGAACTNRFFLREDCHVILLGNESYRWEYEYPSEFGEHWHIRHSHLFPVSHQTIILDQGNTLDQNNVDMIIAEAGL